MTEPIEFTDKEKYIIHFYRDLQGSATKRAIVDELGYLLPSLACVALYIWHGDVGVGLIGYGILLWKVGRDAISGATYGALFRSIFKKYEAKMAELTAARTNEGSS